MKPKYEISIWRDEYNSGLNRFVEHKEIVIGSDTMTSENRARNPKLINNINGTNKFSFDLYYRYIDTRTGEEVENPYVPYLVNERKIKVLWKGEWYDLLVKQIKEDQAQRIFTYTCEDSYITELSRTGFELEFATELENNIDTAPNLIKATIENTEWRFDDEQSDKIYQLTEEPVYETKLLNAIENVEKCPEGTGNLDVGAFNINNVLLYYSFAPNKDDLENKIQIYYTNDPEGFKHNVNEMLVINGDCYNLTVTWDISGNTATAKVDSIELFTIDFDTGLSNRYRAERYVQSQQTAYNDIVGRYVYLFNDSSVEPKIVCGYSTTEYNDAQAVVNLITNPANFKNVSGWTSNDDNAKLTFKIWPEFNRETTISKYVAISYLKLDQNNNEYLYSNSGIQNNRAYINNGFIAGDKYIFRIRAHESNEDGKSPNITNYIQDAGRFNILFQSTGEEPTTVFELDDIENNPHYDQNNNWFEYQYKCVKSCSYNDLLSSDDSCDIKIAPAGNPFWIEEIQFYPLRMGVKVIQPDNESEEPREELVRINPGEMDIQSVAQVVWKYFYQDQPAGTTINTLEYLETTPEPSINYIPLTNDYLSFAMIEESQSNRFNILQSIAEKFKCWVRFRVEHDPETGYILYDSKGPRKFIGVKVEAGEETGIGFIYGIDLKGVTRDIKSDKISTKTIVLQNDNEFGKNGFCTIARSQYNYPKENTIFNFDYYIQQGLLDRNIIQNDLYGTLTGIRYYKTLHDLNTQYEINLDEYLNKNSELTRQKASQTVYEQYLTAAKEEKNSIVDSLMKLAGTDNWDYVNQYAQAHRRDTKVQSLLDDYAIINQTITVYQNLYLSISDSVGLLETRINELIDAQNSIIDSLRDKNTEFYKKYARYIQEGTWTSEDYWDDDLYYLDALQVAYESSRPQISYNINVMRLSDLEDYASKVFKLGDISFIQDVKYFGYNKDGITPYKEKVVLTEITSNFDTPDKDTIKVQNYLNQFDDLFQRITAATQNLEFSEGKYARAANLVADDGTIKASIIQETFNSNKDLIYGAQNESVTMDNTGVTVSDNGDASHLLKITSGGVFVSNDGGETWKNAIRGDGINTELLTAGRINTENITVYNGEHPSFRWDSTGINAYGYDSVGVDTRQMVRFDQYGMYGLKLPAGTEDPTFTPTSIDDIYDNASFGLTWEKFFMKRTNGGTGASYKSIEISTVDDIVVRQGESEDEQIIRVKIGCLDEELDNYGIYIANKEGQIVFKSDNTGAQIAGWLLGQDSAGIGYLKSEETVDNHYIQIKANGSIGSYGGDEHITTEGTYRVVTTSPCTAIQLDGTSSEPIPIPSGTTLWVFESSVGKLTAEYIEQSDVVDPQRELAPPEGLPVAPSIIQFVLPRNPKINYELINVEPHIILDKCQTSQKIEEISGLTFTTYSYTFINKIFVKNSNSEIVLTINSSSPHGSNADRYVPAADTDWYIDSNGSAVFHDINADGGQIAGWWISNDKIYQTYDGTPNGKIKTQLSATGATGSDGNLYSIITDAVNAAMATLGGVILSNGLVNGFNIAQIAKLAKEAKDKADSALTKSRADQLYAAASHRHRLNCNVHISYESSPGHSTTIYGFNSSSPYTGTSTS